MNLKIFLREMILPAFWLLFMGFLGDNKVAKVEQSKIAKTMGKRAELQHSLQKPSRMGSVTAIFLQKTFNLGGIVEVGQ